MKSREFEKLIEYFPKTLASVSNISHFYKYCYFLQLLRKNKVFLPVEKQIQFQKAIDKTVNEDTQIDNLIGVFKYSSGIKYDKHLNDLVVNNIKSNGVGLAHGLTILDTVYTRNDT